MKAMDFEYDGINLSDFDCVICSFDSPDIEEVTMGSEITFNTSYVRGNNKFMLNSIAYDSCLETEFCICKNPCDVFTEQDMNFSIDEQLQIMRWLNRGEYLKFILIDDEYRDIYYEGSFYNIEKIELSDYVIGFRLHLTTNSPFAFHNPEVFKFEITTLNNNFSIYDISNHIGYVYAEIEITCKESGDLRIINSFDDRITEIKNCSYGEKITMKDMIIESSLYSHQSTLMNDFNFRFLRISNRFRQRINKLSFSLPCSVILKYTPIMKVGI